MKQPSENLSFRVQLERSIGRAIDLPAVAEPAGVLSVVRGLAWPMLLNDPSDARAWALLEPLWSAEIDATDVDVVDAAGLSRGAYRGLLARAMFGAIAASDRVLTGQQGAVAAHWADGLAAEIARITPADASASGGDRWAAAVWIALAVHAGGDLLHDDRLHRQSQRCINRLISLQQSRGCYLTASAANAPETFWFHELQIVHAVASYGAHASDASALASAARAVRFHLAETQPDHATSQPWGLSAFLLDPTTEILGLDQLHAAEQLRVGFPAGHDAVTLILMADALESIRRRI